MIVRLLFNTISLTIIKVLNSNFLYVIYNNTKKDTFLESEM